MLKIKTTKMDPKPNFYMLSKEDIASVCFYKLKYLSYQLSCCRNFEKFVYFVLG
jgi:hypothetical protein